MAQPVLLPAFGSKPGENWFRNAFKWDRDAIYDWLEKASRGEVGGDRSKDPAVQRLLKDAVSKIKALSLLDGTNYKSPEPYSHFPRSIIEDWDASKKDTDSRFKLWEWEGIYTRGPKDAKISIPYWNPYDLLGYFLSLLGPAPTDATKNNFFLPLTAVYGRWCSKIAGAPPGQYGYKPPVKGAGTWPYMYQCTWYDAQDSQSKKWFFLGASISGDAFLPPQVGQFKKLVQTHRFNIVRSYPMVKLIQNGDFKWSPEQINTGGSGNPFGNCAETYPFTEKFYRDRNKNQNLSGLALQRDFMSNPNTTEYNGLKEGEVWTNLVGPCQNCAFLLQKAGAQQARFAPEYEKDQAP